jgi:outer membrane autotransporter protein
MAGELAGNAMRLAMQQPAQSVFRHLDNVAPLRSPFAGTVRGQVREGFNTWFTPFGQAEHAKSDGNTFDGYDLSRYGFYLGGDIEIYKRAVAGVLFGYTNPSVKSDLGKISANDYTAAAYLRMPLAWEAYFNVMVGFGSQDYQYKNTFGNSKFGGNSLFGGIELSRSIPIATCRLIPLVALDYQSAAMNEFVAYDPVLGGVFVEPERLDSAIIRVGLLGEAWRIRTRVQYMRQIAGKDYVSSRTSVLGDDLFAATPVRSTQWGKDWLNVGVGGTFLETQHWRISADYNYDMGKQTTSHMGSLNTILTW